MREAYGLPIPEGLEDVCVPSRCAVIIYDIQVGIVSQLAEGAAIAARCSELLEAARDKGFRVFFTRHLYLPNSAAGIGQFRRAMIWQRKDDPMATKPWMMRGSPGWEIIPELAQRHEEVVIDKITMSAFEGTFLNLAMRDARLDAFIVAGIAFEVGIEPTVRQGMDLNYLPILAVDGCGSKTPEAKERSLETLKETGEAFTQTTADLVAEMRRN